MPTLDGRDDPLGVGGPGEGLGMVVGVFEEAVDGSLKIDDRVEYPALEAAVG